ncbi:MAG TPA: flagellin, partial [Alphaproteobacteria bacterium]|nr:flagellin [Alphaproteobacteria bacterium]
YCSCQFQSGADGTNTLSADLTSIDLSSAGLGLTGAVGASATALSTQASAAATSAELDNAIANVANARSQVGATLSTFSTRGSVLETDTENLIADQSAIQDVDIGEASKNFKSSNLLSDASIAAEAQTNRLRSSVLQLVR